MRARAFWVVTHRFVGLALAGFLVIAGLTGSLLVWNEELDAALNPHLFRVVPPAPDAPMLDVLVLRDMTAARTAESIRSFWLRPPAPGHTHIFQPDRERVEQIFVDPYTGNILGRRVWDDISEGIGNLMPFLYRLHYALLLGEAGQLIFGIVALLWTLDCFIGAYLTFPPSVPSAPAGAFWSQWAKSWRLRWWGGFYRFNVDVHRAGGLWLWAMLLVLAWSSVAFNLRDVYEPTMRALFAHQQEIERPALSAPRYDPSLRWPQALTVARHLMANEARQRGFTIAAEDWFLHDPERNVYVYDVRTSLDISERQGKTRIVFDADNGALLHVHLPSGAAAGDTIYSWIATLHQAHIWGLPFRTFMTLMGLVVAALSLTGIVIWWKKREARRYRSE
ncbi:PepSY domain-containing protein [Reyranella sp. CPCC 100927]|uniref:PepSY-associated TM helix domain-containing protein n=1 Tax=Reyranella sp. CPCC 100927 TaxID=2599616 RepID=UPI0011B81235|nr:PepSY-associated TM helix domain-containing protein [Reyranella sp. CPCC 100927]TWT15194.1 PepSY domain-containing protein [Reyranella sp. CPCC 100927]